MIQIRAKLRINALAAHSFVIVAQGGVEASGCPLEVDLVADAESRQDDEKYRQERDPCADVVHGEPTSDRSASV